MRKDLTPFETDQDISELAAGIPDDATIDAAVAASVDPSKNTEEREGKEVFAWNDRPFEAPPKDIVRGPFYRAVDEVMPEVSERPEDESEEAKASRFALNRRNFMRLFSASAVMGASACVRRPVEKIIPYVNQPDGTVPGVPVYYATTCGECANGCGVVTATREGYPIKLEGIATHPINQGGLCALGQASIQGLYHPQRLQQPQMRVGQRLDPIEWDSAYDAIAKRVQSAKRIGIVVNGSTGHQRQFFAEFLKKLGHDETTLYTYDSNSLYDSITAAHRLAFGVEAMPRIDLSQAHAIVSLGSDFLDTGTSPVYHSKNFAHARSLAGGAFAKLTVFESALTQTGTKADTRYPIPANTEVIAGLALVKALLDSGKAKGSAAEQAEIRKVLDANAESVQSAASRLGVAPEAFTALANELLAGRSAVLAGSAANFNQDATALQLTAIMANVLTGAYDSTLFLSQGWMVAPGEPGGINRFLKDAPNLDLVFFIGVNPAFTLPPSWGFDATVAKIPTVVAIDTYPTETTRLAHYVLPAFHYLEAWGDEQPVAGFWSIRQPTVRPINHARQTEEMFMWLAAKLDKPMGYADYRAYLLERWKEVQQLVGQQAMPTELFFNAVLRRGYIGKPRTQTLRPFGNVAGSFKLVATQPTTKLTLVSPFHAQLHDGRGANLPVLQEAGDGLTSVCWDSWAAINPATAQKRGLRRNDVVKIDGPAGSFLVAIYPLPGVQADTLVVPRGNGHTDYTEIANEVGVNPLVAYPQAVDELSGAPVTGGIPVDVTATGKVYQLAALQKHFDTGNRLDIVKLITLDQAKKATSVTKNLDDVPNLYPSLQQAKYRWGMAVDLTRCTGCAACVVACHLENNIPQVGRADAMIGRSMHWIRIDRYFAGPSENPLVTYQPMMCQQCNHAPCEPVCPVYATTHDPEGINTQTYNRCVGTRYCANSCPYKVRRFNWYTHKWNVIGDRPQDRSIRALNPDVTVRTRGIMEKCTFCVQRLRATKLVLQESGQKLRDGDVKTACQQTCPSDAIYFGDLLDPNSEVSKARRDGRAYLALNGDPEEKEYGLKTVPNVSYLMQITRSELPGGEAGSDSRG